MTETFETFNAEGVTQVPDANQGHFSRAMFYRTEDDGDIVYLLREDHHTDTDVSNGRSFAYKILNAKKIKVLNNG